MGLPTISIVLPNYNHSRFLREALQAVLAQSYRLLEVIVIDDGSTDDSMEVIESFQRTEPHLRSFRHDRNRGVVYTLNRGMELAEGEYVFFTAADDKVLPGLIETSMKLLARYPQAGLCSTLSRLIDINGNDKGVFPTQVISQKPSFLSPVDCLRTLRRRGTWFMGNTTIYKRQALLNAGGFIPELGSHCDGFTQQVVALRHGACFIPEPLACWRKMETGYASRISADLRRTREILNHAAGLMRSTYRDVFPLDYVKEWERNNLYSAEVCAMEGVRRQREQSITDLGNRLCTGQMWLDKAFIRVLRLTAGAQAVWTKIYLFMKFRPFRAWLEHRVLSKMRGSADRR